MNIFFEPVNLNQWNMFEKVSGKGHIEAFLATKSMEIGDLMLLHVGVQNKDFESGVYAIGTIINGPYILTNSPDDYCNEKNTVDVRIENISYEKPLITHEKSKEFISQFRTVHKIKDEYYPKLIEIIDSAKKREQYWEYALPLIRDKLGGEGYPYYKSKPANRNTIDGFFAGGISGVHLYSSIGTRKCLAGLWIDVRNADTNKAIFDFLYSKKKLIQSNISMPIIWDRKETSSSSIYVVIEDINCLDEDTWQSVREFHAKMLKEIADYIYYPYEDYIKSICDINYEVEDTNNELSGEIAKYISTKSLSDRIAQKNSKTTIVESVVKSYRRDPYIAEYTKRRANGKCQLCGHAAPFLDRQGKPYLESHHIIWLSNGGTDTINNTVALCPNCHKKMHIVNDSNDVEVLKIMAEKSIDN